MRRLYPSWLLGCLLFAGCKDHAPSATDPLIVTAKADWRVHQLVLEAAEHAADCAAAGTAMRTVFTSHAAEIRDAAKPSQDPHKIQVLVEYMEAHPSEFPDLDDRWAALIQRCATEPSVKAVVQDLDGPSDSAH